MTIERYSEEEARVGKSLKNINCGKQLKELKLLTLSERKIFNYFEY